MNDVVCDECGDFVDIFIKRGAENICEECAE